MKPKEIDAHLDRLGKELTEVWEKIAQETDYKKLDNLYKLRNETIQAIDDLYKLRQRQGKKP